MTCNCNFLISKYQYISLFTKFNDTILARPAPSFFAKGLVNHSVFNDRNQLFCTPNIGGICLSGYGKQWGVQISPFMRLARE